MKKIRPRHGPEYRIERDVKKFLRARGWWVEKMHGNMYQKGIPDLLLAHKKFGLRFVDVKNPVSWEYTKAQCQKWPVWDRYGIGIWIMVAATEEEYDKLFKPPNWRNYWKPRYDAYLMSTDALLAELLHDENQQLPNNTVVMGRPKKTALDLTIQETDISWLDEFQEKNKHAGT